MVLIAAGPWTLQNDDGTGQFGTVWADAWTQAAKTSIDAVTHSATNPAISPAQIIDEVVTARGNKANLNARIASVIDPDGVLLTPVSLVTTSALQASVGATNVALNGDLFDWSGGGAAAPDNWTLSGAGATIAQTGIGMGDTFHFGTGSGFAAKITRAGTDWKFLQTIIAGADIAKFANVKGQKVSVSLKVKTNIAALCRVTVDDGVLTTSSIYHTGSNVEEALTVTHTISATATKLEVYVQGIGSNGDAYVGGIQVFFSDTVASDWKPISGGQDASATARGLVNIAAGGQSFKGPKTFIDAATFSALATFTLGAQLGIAPTYKPGGDAAYSAVVNGLISGSVDLTQHANVSTGLTDLSAYALVAGLMNTNNRAIKVTAFGTFAANANVKSLFFKFGATTFTLQSGAINGGGWTIIAIIFRVGAASQKGIVVGYTRNGAGDIQNVFASPAETLANSITVKTQGQSGTASSDIVQEGFFVETIGL